MTTPDHHHLPLRDYDHRPLAIQILRHRLDALAHGAQPTPGRQQWGPDYPPSPHETSPVSPGRAAPPMHPPRHGDPAQPGKPKGDRPPI